MKYIDSEKLIAEIKRYKNKADERLKIKGRSYAEEEKDSALQNLCGNLLHFISSLQQRPETPSGEEVMTMCNQILIDWVKEGKTPEEREQREQAHIRFFELYDEYMQEQPGVSSNLIDCDTVRDDFIAEVYRVLDADPTNDRANAIIDAFDSLPTVPQQPEVALEKGETINTEILLGENGKPYIHSFEVYDYNKNIPLFLPGTEVTLQIRKVEQNG